MILEFVICVIFLAVINVTDIKGYKIKNMAVLPLLVVGLVLGAVNGTFLDSFCGLLIPLVLFPLYALRMLGAGDVKSLCAIGAVLGFRLSVITMLLTFVAGGLIALIMMLLSRTFIKRMQYMWSYFLQCLSAKKVESYRFGGDDKSYFRFSYAITGGVLLTGLNQLLNWI